MTTIETANTTSAPVKTLAQKLQAEARANPVFADLCKVFSERQRTRQQVTMDNLVIIMEAKGFKYTREQYKEALKALASIGIGRIVSGKKGQVKALVDVKYTLQSLGRVAIGVQDKAETFKPATRYAKLEAAAMKPSPPPAGAASTSEQMPTDGREIRPRNPVVQVNFKNNTVDIALPRALTPEEFTQLLASMYSKDV